MGQNDFSEKAKSKTKNQLIDILTNKEEYNPDLVSAAEIELRNRRNRKTTKEVKENIGKNIQETQKKIGNSKALKSTGKTAKKTFAIILIIIGVPLSFFSLTSAIFAGPHTFVPLMIIMLFIGVIILVIGVKML